MPSPGPGGDIPFAPRRSPGGASEAVHWEVKEHFARGVRCQPVRTIADKGKLSVCCKLVCNGLPPRFCGGDFENHDAEGLIGVAPDALWIVPG